MKSIRGKLVLMYIALVFIVMVSSGTFMIIAIRDSQFNKTEETLIKHAAQINEQIIDKDRDFQEELNKFLTNYQVYIINSSGATIASSTTEDKNNYPVFRQSSLQSALEGKDVFEVGRKYLDINLKEKIYIEYAKSILDEQGFTKYVIFIRLDATDIYSDMSDTTNIIAFAVLLAMILTGVLGTLFSSTLTKPIILITAKAKELAQGNLNQVISVQAKDEIGELTMSFNNMARALSFSMERIENEKNKLEIVLYNMTDGVLSYDNQGKIIHANQVSKEFLGAHYKEDLSFDETIEIFKIDISKNDLDKNETESTELSDMKEDNNSFKEVTIFLGDKYINASINYYNNSEGVFEGIIMVLQDITKHINLDNMRKEFVANVSHEIRTPLTTIKSYTETLIDGAIEEHSLAMEFLDIINNEADRMALIVKDLLDLSSLDNSQIVFNLAPVDLVELVKLSIRQISITAQKDNKKIHLEVADEIDFTVNVDKARIIQVLVNILSNSIKYSPSNTDILVTVSESHLTYNVYVKDNGFGIPKEDLSRIFERFYRVDKARSRAMGGTGLGLSIAKDIMNSHGGQISASSEFGSGTTMVLKLPKQMLNKSYISVT